MGTLLPPSGNHIRIFLFPFYTLIKLCYTKALELSSLVPGPKAKSSSSEITNWTPFTIIYQCHGGKVHRQMLTQLYKHARPHHLLEVKGLSAFHRMSPQDWRQTLLMDTCSLWVTSFFSVHVWFRFLNSSFNFHFEEWTVGQDDAGWRIGWKNGSL